MYEISKVKPDFPVEAKRGPHFYMLHPDNMHEVDGEEIYSIPAALAIKHLAANKDSVPGHDAIKCLMGSCGVHTNSEAIKAGVTDPHSIFFRAHSDHFVVTPDKGEVLRLRLDSVIAQIVDHTKWKSAELHPEQILGGVHSENHLAALDAFLKELGLEPNHARIVAEFCKDCGK